MTFRQDLQLRPAGINQVAEHIALGYRTQTHYDRYPEVIRDDKTFIVFPFCKDSADPKNNRGVPYVWHEIRDYFFRYSQIPKMKSQQHIIAPTLLIPLGNCRGFFKARGQLFKRQHAVLAEIDCEEKKIIVHDSQPLLSYIYPNKFQEFISELKLIKKACDSPQITKELKEKLQAQLENEYKYFAEFIKHEYEIDVRSYGAQVNTNYECGYFVLDYLKSILKAGNSDSCAKIGKNVWGLPVGLGIAKYFTNPKMKTIRDILKERYGLPINEDDKREIKVDDFTLIDDYELTFSEADYLIDGEDLSLGFVNVKRFGVEEKVTELNTILKELATLKEWQAQIERLEKMLAEKSQKMNQKSEAKEKLAEPVVNSDEGATVFSQTTLFGKTSLTLLEGYHQEEKWEQKTIANDPF